MVHLYFHCDHAEFAWIHRNSFCLLSCKKPLLSKEYCNPQRSGLGNRFTSTTASGDSVPWAEFHHGALFCFCHQRPSVPVMQVSRVPETTAENVAFRATPHASRAGIFLCRKIFCPADSGRKSPDAQRKNIWLHDFSAGYSGLCLHWCGLLATMLLLRRCKMPHSEN